MAINPSARVNITRSVTQVDGIMTFHLLLLITQATEISYDLFVMKIVDEADPQQDVFARVATLSDLGVLHANRNDAIADGSLEYRTSTVELEYDDVEVAAAADNEVRARLNTLVIQWETYVNQFATTDPAGYPYTFPNADASVLQAAIDAYEKAKESTEQAETVLGEKNDDLVDADSTHTNCIANIAGLEYMNLALPYYVDVLGNTEDMRWNLANASNELSAAVGYMTAAGASQAEIDEIKTAQQLTYSAYVRANDDYKPAANTENINRTNARNAKIITCNSNYDAIVAAQLEVSQAQKEYDAKQAAESEDLAEVQDLCPGWTPEES